MITTPTLSSSRFSATPCKSVGKLDQFGRAHAAQAVDAREIRADLDDRSDLVFLDAGLELLDLLFENTGDFVCVYHPFTFFTC